MKGLVLARGYKGMVLVTLALSILPAEMMQGPHSPTFQGHTALSAPHGLFILFSLQAVQEPEVGKTINEDLTYSGKWHRQLAGV